MPNAQKSFATAMRKLYKEEKGADVTIVCGDVRLKVHSAVLIARFIRLDNSLLLIKNIRSEFFEAKITRWADEKREVVLDGCDPAALAVVVDFMYGTEMADLVMINSANLLV